MTSNIGNLRSLSSLHGVANDNRVPGKPQPNAADPQPPKAQPDTVQHNGLEHDEKQFLEELLQRHEATMNENGELRNEISKLKSTAEERSNRMWRRIDFAISTAVASALIGLLIYAWYRDRHNAN